MADRVLLHVGLPKSGTTYLQTLLWGSKPALREAGILLPGKQMFAHNLAAKAVRGAAPGSPAEKTWGRLLGAVRDWPGTAVLSNEWFTLADAEQAARAVAALAPAEVHVVVTARALTGLVPAAWQETLKLGAGSGLDAFVGSLEAPRERWSWWTLDPADVLERWGAALPADRVHVVTVPPRADDPHLLWRRFADACGIPADAVDLTRSSANESLGAESARLLQRLGPRLRDAVDADTAAWGEQYRWLRRFVAHELLVPRRGSRIALREKDHRLLAERSDRVRADLSARGYRVHGDLDDLAASGTTAVGVHPDDVPDGDVLAAAEDLAAGLLRTLRDVAAGERDLPA